MTGSLSQAEVVAAEHVMVRGTITGECAGRIRVDLISPDPPGQGGGPKGPMTTVDLEAIGPFEIAAPTGRSASIAVICDGDRDGKIGGEEDRLSQGRDLGQLTADVSDVSLELLAMVGMGGGGPPPGGGGGPPPGGEGGPPPGGEGGPPPGGEGGPPPGGEGGPPPAGMQGPPPGGELAPADGAAGPPLGG